MDFGQVCSLPGFTPGKVTGPRGQAVREQTSGPLDADWFCDLSFSDDERRGPFTRLAVIRSPALTTSLRDTNTVRAQCSGRETLFALDNAGYPWEPQERAASGLPSARALEKAFVAAASKAPGCTPSA
ncbi:hypothetical protein [Streptomyces sp. PvR034]|uniref:hypothetical protein n=1 Tax=Streptomyces sp. PvR034 TaxID=3156401 RepID=UPI003395653D